MRIAIGIEYDGTPFFGWQSQRVTPTVQGSLEFALGKIAQAPVKLHAGGRTDTGVHALMQVAHFDTQTVRPLRAWVLGGNAHLHAGASVLWARTVSDEFHARFSAIARRYRYVVCNRLSRPALMRSHAAWIHHPLNVPAMQQGALALLGEHDFSAYRTVHCQAKSPVKTLQELTIRRVETGDIEFEFQATGFLHHMVRNIVGSLLEVGAGERDPSWIAEVLASADRKRAGVTAAPQGLTFLGPIYPEHFGLPRSASLEQSNQ